jgi:hypothetical protein
MTSQDLREEISIELEAMGIVVREARSLYHDISHGEASIREKTAAATFMAQFYGGVEHVLKRIHRFYDLQLPTGESWHIEIFKRFCNPPYPGLPLLFDQHLARQLAPFRKFRHVVYHGYGFQLEWDRMQEGLAAVPGAYDLFSNAISNYLDSLN